MDVGDAPDLKMNRGDTPSWRMSFTRAGSPIALSPGTLIWMTAKQQLIDPDVSAVFQKSVGAGITVVNIAQGLADVSLVHNDTANLPDVDHVLLYDVQLIELGGRITSYRGKLAVACDLTEAIT